MPDETPSTESPRWISSCRMQPIYQRHSPAEGTLSTRLDRETKRIKTLARFSWRGLLLINIYIYIYGNVEFLLYPEARKEINASANYYTLYWDSVVSIGILRLYSDIEMQVLFMEQSMRCCITLLNWENSNSIKLAFSILMYTANSFFTSRMFD